MPTRLTLSGVLAVLVLPGPCLAETGASLRGLELSADKTDIERLRIPLNEAFAPSRLDYSATVDASYTTHVLITPKAAPAEVVDVKVDGVAVRPDEPHQVALRPGANTFAIAVEPRRSGPPTTYRLTVTQKDLSKEYRSEPLSPGAWRIRDFAGTVGNEDMYLFEGKGRALLVDTGMGRGDLAGYVRTLTKLPVDVAITHGNRDHFLQVDQFPDATVYMSEKDVTRLPPSLVTPHFKWVKDGDVIDIGAGRRFEVVEVPGHSLGSVLYVDFAKRLAVTGDAISSGSMVYVFAPTCTALDQYLAALKKLEARISGLDGLNLLVGHHYQEKTPLTGRAGKQLVTDMRTAAEKVLRGELTGTLAHTVRDGRTVELRQASVGLAGLWYNPKNLVTDPAALGFLDVRTPASQPVIPKPVFSSFETSYAATVASDAAQIVITPTAYHPGHKRIAINGRPVASASALALDLGSGENRIEIAVTGADDSVRTYSLAITRHAAAARPEQRPPSAAGIAELSGQWVDPVTDAPPGTTYHVFETAARGKGTKGSYLVYLPPSYEKEPTRRYPVLYWLHGGFGNARQGAWAVENLDRGIRAGLVPEAIVVLPQALPVGWYVNSKDGKRPVEDVLVKDLIPHIDASYRTLAQRGSRGIEGMSMGGYGALHLGMKYPSLFGAISSVAPSILPDLKDEPKERTFDTFFDDETYYDANGPWALAREGANALRHGCAIRILAGDQDTRLRPTLVGFHELLSQLAIPHQFKEVKGAGHVYEEILRGLGDEGFAFWRQTFGAAASGK